MEKQNIIESTVEKNLGEPIVSANVLPRRELAAPQKGQPRAGSVGANATRRKSVLGRGLNALMASSVVSIEPENNANPENPESNSALASLSVDAPAGGSWQFGSQNVKDVAPEPQDGGLLYLSVDRLVANQSQPRQQFAKQELSELSKSIKNSGVLQPIIVRRLAGDPGVQSKFEIVAGERRFRAAQTAGLKRIPAIVKQLNDRETLELGIIENIQRSDLNPIEEAIAFERLIHQYGATQEEISSTVSKSRVAVTNALRLLKLEPELRKLIEQGELTAGHGRALLMLSSAAQRQTLAEQCKKEGLSVREAEKLAAELVRVGDTIGGSKQTKKKTDSKQRVGVLEIEQRVRQALGTKVRLSRNKKGAGELRISFFSDAELESLLERLGA